MELAKDISYVESHAISDNGPSSRGLEHIYRMNIHRLQEELKAAEKKAATGGESGVKEVTELKMQLKKLQGEHLELKQDLLSADHEQDKLQKNLRGQMDKYYKLVEEKYDLEENLIKSEEAKLKISKAMLDLRLKNTKLAEEASDKNTDLKQRVLQLESEVMDRDVKLDDQRSLVQEQTENMQQAERQKNKLETEMLAIKETYALKDQEYKAEVARAQEMDVELLNLLSEKNAIADELKAITNERDELRVEVRSQSQKLDKQSEKL